MTSNFQPGLWQLNAVAVIDRMGDAGDPLPGGPVHRDIRKGRRELRDTADMVGVPMCQQNRLKSHGFLADHLGDGLCLTGVNDGGVLPIFEPPYIIVVQRRDCSRLHCLVFLAHAT